MEYTIVIAGKIYEFSDWLLAVKFAVQQALNHENPVKMSSGLTRYQVWANGEVDRLEVYCACDTCQLCDNPNGSATCPRYWEHSSWEQCYTYEG